MRINSVSDVSWLFLLLLAIGFTSHATAQGSSMGRVNVRVVTDEADAVLQILAKREAGQQVTESDWQRVFSSEGTVA